MIDLEKLMTAIVEDGYLASLSKEELIQKVTLWENVAWQNGKALDKIAGALLHYGFRDMTNENIVAHVKQALSRMKDAEDYIRMSRQDG